MTASLFMPARLYISARLVMPVRLCMSAKYVLPAEGGQVPCIAVGRAKTVRRTPRLSGGSEL